MNYKEYGSENKEVIMFLHGGGLSWWNYREEAEMLQDRYHVVIPILDGHAGSDRHFTSIEDNAAEIIAFIDEHFGGSVLMMGGLSYGAQVLVEILSQRKDICRHALVESAMVIPSKFTNSMIKPAFGSSFRLIKQRWFARLQFKSMHMKPELFEDYYRDTCAIEKADLIALLQANTAYELKESFKCSYADVHIYIGQRENKGIRASACKMQSEKSGTSWDILPGLYHGEFSINHADDYVREVELILNGVK